MLNGGRTGVIDACREARIAQIGDGRDWTAVEPDVFVASAIADTERLVAKWIEYVVGGRLVRGEVRYLGIEDRQAVRLAMAPQVPRDVRAIVDRYAADLVGGRLALPLEYTGTEFAP